MERFYKSASRLSGDAQKLSEELFKFNPSFEGDNGKKSLATLAGVAKALEANYRQLRIDLILQYEKEQLIE